MAFGASLVDEHLDPLDYSENVQRLSAALGQSGGAIGAVITSGANIRWLTGFTGSSAIVVTRVEGSSPAVLVTDGRYGEQAAREVRDCGAAVEIVVRQSAAEMRTTVADLLVASGKWGVETRDLSLADYEALVAAGGEGGHRITRETFIDVSAVMSELRRTKTRPEVQRIARAAAIADAALGDVGDLLVAGCTERAFRNELDAAMRRRGADDVSFETIVASGPNAALPHHHPSGRRFEPGDSVVLDFGALVDGYHSDMTRSFVIDGPGADEMRARHDVVRRSCEAGVAAVGPGAKASDVDAACRAVLSAAGLESELTHGIGHGVGLVIHESPWLNPRSTDVLRPGDVVTVEPGAYRVGLGGVRVEELLLVTDSGHLVLTNSPKEPTCPPSPPTTSRTA